METPVKASDCKCAECGAQAVAFWPIIDPDIESYPYCRACLDAKKIDLLFRLHEEGFFDGSKSPENG